MSDRWKTMHTYLLAALVGLFVLATANPSMAAAGDLDSSFDQDGRITTAIDGEVTGSGDVAVQDDGKIVTAGWVGSPERDIAVIRYGVDGSLDPGFGVGGSVRTPVDGSASASALALQTDGRILVVGTQQIGSDSFVVLVRYLSNGQLDSSFGTSGVMTLDLTPARPALLGGASAVAIRPDGRIVIGGSVWSSSGPFARMALVRLTPEGTIDTTFGRGGRSFIGFGRGVSTYGWDAALQSDGKIVIVGAAEAPSYGDFAVARATANGALDPAFGDGGRVHTHIGGGSYAEAVAIQEDGRIVVAGEVNPAETPDFGVARYLADGSLDNSFDTDGQQIVDFGPGINVCHDVAIQGDGRIILVGGTEGDLSVARLTSTGGLDPMFNGDGRLLTDFGGEEYAGAVALQADGRILAAGWSITGFRMGPAPLARYLAS